MSLLATATVKRTSEVHQYEYLTGRTDMLFSGDYEGTRYFSSKWNTFYSTCKPDLICGGRGYLGPPAGLWVLWIEIPRMGRQYKLDSHKSLRQREQNESSPAGCRNEWNISSLNEWMEDRSSDSIQWRRMTWIVIKAADVRRAICPVSCLISYSQSHAICWHGCMLSREWHT